MAVRFSFWHIEQHYVCVNADILALVYPMVIPEGAIFGENGGSYQKKVKSTVGRIAIKWQFCKKQKAIENTIFHYNAKYVCLDQPNLFCMYVFVPECNYYIIDLVTSQHTPFSHKHY